jgi:transposase
MSIKLEKTSQTPKVLGNSTDLTPNSELYSQIAALREDKEMSHAKIAKELHVSKSTVQKYLKLWREQVPVADVKQAGRPRKITERVKRQIRAIVSKNPSYSSKDIMNKLAKGGENSSSVDVSSRAVRLALNEMSYKNDLPKVVPMLTEDQKTKRLAWCKKKKTRRDDGRKLYFFLMTRPPLSLTGAKIGSGTQKESDLKWVGKTKFSRKIMFWSAIGTNCKAPLIVLKGTVNTDKYIELLESHFLPWFR